jgi:hypothetical protein
MKLGAGDEQPFFGAPYGCVLSEQRRVGVTEG